MLVNVGARLAQEPVPGVASADELLQRAVVHFERSDPAAAREIATVVAAGDDPVLQARALALLVRCHLVLDEHVEVLALAREALDVCWRIGDRASEAIVHATVARSLLFTSDAVSAMEEIMTALEVAEASGDLAARMLATGTAGTVYYYLEQFDHCLEFCERAAEMARILGDEVTNGAMIDTMACANMCLATAARAAGDEEAAEAISAVAQGQSREAIVIARRLGHRRHEVIALGNLAESLSFSGRAEEALELLTGWQIDPERDSQSIITHIRDTHGSVCLASGRYDEAIGHLRAAMASAESKASAMVSAEHLADAYERNGDLRGALDTYKLFHALSKEVASEAAQRSASIAVVRMETAQAKAAAEEERARVAALQHANQELLRKSLEDPLTGLGNRRHLDQLMAGGLAGHAILLVDVDHFKRVNDEHSHLVGDGVLRLLAGLLRSACRGDDVVVRFGGEEFAVLLSGSDLDNAVTTAERLRAEVAAHDWAAVAPGLTVTVSIGLALGDESTDPGVVLARADERLYAAKRAGRDRVRGPSPVP
ncbi:diguanylate cyclase (GGDEF) domain-containing protein [Actinoplanes philippinensis]|uniref:Diguanylate cyclase (GGDEF) domain-containing protein n=1 Tax=Actinoplanes philippinensis TaxID=35752 RepID=A0A1I2L759_9ACTN|nr:tetratricopeptide repeat-containing diguanylate cyclase [Actinoplanes philippinensis]SFF72956.1 diguanylate cyclase (GGDEF) domain-containing protein [Actinoplanes philippinensis]